MLPVLLIVLFVETILLGMKKGELRVFKMALGALGFLVSAAVVIVLSTILWQFLRRVYYQALPATHTYNSHLYLIAFAALALAIMTLSYLV